MASKDPYEAGPELEKQLPPDGEIQSIHSTSSTIMGEDNSSRSTLVECDPTSPAAKERYNLEKNLTRPDTQEASISLEAEIETVQGDGHGAVARYMHDGGENGRSERQQPVRAGKPLRKRFWDIWCCCLTIPSIALLLVIYYLVAYLA